MLKVLLVVVLLAVATYLVTRAIQERNGGAPVRRPSWPTQLPKRPHHPRRPVAPDDDEDFLRDLERKRRHRQDPET